MDEELTAGMESGVEEEAGGLPGGVPEGALDSMAETGEDGDGSPGLEDLPLFGGDEDGPDGEAPLEDGPLEDAPEGQGAEPPDNQEAPQFIDVGGQRMPVQEVVQAVQLGSRAAREVLELREQAALLEEFAQIAGMDKDTYLSALREQLEQTRVQREAQRMGVAPEAARQMMDARRQQEQAQALLRRQQQAQMEEQQRRARMAPYLELLERYPELNDPAKMPPEVTAQIRQGANPVIAYQDYVLRHKQAMDQVGRQRDAAKGRSPGSAAGVGDGAVDDALAAFEAAMNE